MTDGPSIAVVLGTVAGISLILVRHFGFKRALLGYIALLLVLLLGSAILIAISRIWSDTKRPNNSYPTIESPPIVAPSELQKLSNVLPFTAKTDFGEIKYTAAAYTLTGNIRVSTHIRPHHQQSILHGSIARAIDLIRPSLCWNDGPFGERFIAENGIELQIFENGSEVGLLPISTMYCK